jgi:hypothetical protein
VKELLKVFGHFARVVAALAAAYCLVVAYWLARVLTEPIQTEGSPAGTGIFVIALVGAPGMLIVGIVLLVWGLRGILRSR